MSAFEPREVEPLEPIELDVGDITAAIVDQINPILARLFEEQPSLDESEREAIGQAVRAAAFAAGRVAAGQIAGAFETQTNGLIPMNWTVEDPWDSL